MDPGVELAVSAKIACRPTAKQRREHLELPDGAFREAQAECSVRGEKA